MKPWNTMEFHCVRVLKDFGNVKEGQLGGWIEKEDNLSHDRNCWVYEDAKVYEYARVRGRAQIYGHVHIYDDPCMRGNTSVSGGLKIVGSAEIYDNAVIETPVHYFTLNLINNHSITLLEDKNNISNITRVFKHPSDITFRCTLFTSGRDHIIHH